MTRDSHVSERVLRDHKQGVVLECVMTGVSHQDREQHERNKDKHADHLFLDFEVSVEAESEYEVGVAANVFVAFRNWNAQLIANRFFKRNFEVFLLFAATSAQVQERPNFAHGSISHGVFLVNQLESVVDLHDGL